MFRQNASHEENMAALVEDATALCIGAFVSVGLSLLCCAVAVALISWSALRQVPDCSSFNQSVKWNDVIKDPRSVRQPVRM